MKIAQLCANFFFRVGGVGWGRCECVICRVSSDTVVENMENSELRNQFDDLRSKFIERLPNDHPVITCGEVEGAMYSWLSMKPYSWTKKVVKDDVVYPKVAVEASSTPELLL